VVNSEMFSVDGGATWMSRAAYDASGPAVTITSAPHAGGTDPLIWNFGSVEPGDSLPLIKYQIQVDPTLVSGTYNNTATIISNIGADEDGNGVGDNKSALYQLKILPEIGLDVQKAVDHPIYEVNQPFEFDLIYKNLGTINYTNAEFIDILPYNNDGSLRSPSSDYNGTFELTKITSNNSEVLPAGYVPAASDVCYNYYTMAMGAPSNKPANTFAGGGAAGTGAITWTACSSINPVTCGALNNEDITGIRFVVPSMLAASGGHKVTITLDPTGNVGGTPDLDINGNVTMTSTGDIYTNNLGGRVSEISLVVISNDVSVTVVDGTIGDTVWWDQDQDGNGPAGAGNGSDTSELPIPGTTVELLDGSGNPVYVDPTTGGIVDAAWPGAIPYTTVTDTNDPRLWLYQTL